VFDAKGITKINATIYHLMVEEGVTVYPGTDYWRGRSQVNPNADRSNDGPQTPRGRTLRAS